MIPLARPDLTDLERKAVLEVLKTPNLSLGPKLKEFEEKIASYIGIKYAIAINSGTSALHLVIRALGIGKGDEVITSPFSFIASANCILYVQANPVFVDIDPETLNIDVDRIEKRINEKTKAILAIDIFGLPAEWEVLERRAKKYNLYLIEDSAEALGAEYKGKKTGSFGDAGIFGFYPNKQITTGEGGMVVTNNEKIAELCISMRNQGRNKGQNWLQHKRLGYNYRLSEVNCALGIAQLERIEEILKKREEVAKMYNGRLKDKKGLKIPSSFPELTRSWFVYVVQLEKGVRRKERDKIIKELKKKEIECGNYFPPIHLQPFYRKNFGYKLGDFPVTEGISERTIALPFHNNLKEKEIDYVCKNLLSLI